MTKLFHYELNWSGYVAAESHQEAVKYFNTSRRDIVVNDTPDLANVSSIEITRVGSIDLEWRNNIPWGLTDNQKTCKQIVEESLEKK